MNSNPHNLTTSESASESAFSPAEETLRLVASLPAPDGLEDRVNAALSAAERRGRVLAWPRAIRPESGWMRTAAAASLPNLPRTWARMARWVSAAISGVAVLPVPMAQTGS